MSEPQVNQTSVFCRIKPGWEEKMLSYTKGVPGAQTELPEGLRDGDAVLWLSLNGNTHSSVQSLVWPYKTAQIPEELIERIEKPNWNGLAK